jgi:hypothetical protein
MNDAEVRREALLLVDELALDHYWAGVYCNVCGYIIDEVTPHDEDCRYARLLPHIEKARREQG